MTRPFGAPAPSRPVRRLPAGPFLVLTLLALSATAADIAQLRHQPVVAGERICVASALNTFYTRRHDQPAWDDANIAALLRAIDNAPNDGLDPAPYHRAALTRTTSATRDVLATDAFLLLASHLSRGRVDAEFSRPSWCTPPGRIDTAAVLENALDTRTVEPSLARMAPRHDGYTRLRAALADYRAAGSWPLVPAGKKLKLGDRNARVIALRQRLALEPRSPAVDTASDAFDETLGTAVRFFQAHHGLDSDGVVGAQTLAALNVPAAERVKQIEMSLERWRWMPDDPGRVYVIVNIAAFRLDVIEQGHSALSMKTIVGKHYTRTPFFAARIEEILVNPWWNVPDSIAYKELWPKQRRDSGYFAREHLVVSGGRIRQTPGEWNSLGRLKFNMPNSFNVYLHDTPAKSLFSAAVRTFSHGCIRLERPMELALYLLRDQPQFNQTVIESMITTGGKQHIPLKQTMPVFVLYWTAVVGDDGHVERYRDVYARAAALAAQITDQR